MKVGDRLAELLTEFGIEYVFGVPGGQTLPLYEGIRKTNGKLQHVLMRDERSAGFAADAYARLTGRTGVCDATVGPGATNLVSALAEAHCSSIPLLAIISDIPRSWEHRRVRGNASQAIQQLDIFKTISKWQVSLSEPNSLENIVANAFRVATTGKPGPVVIAMPDDIGPAEFQRKSNITPTGQSNFPRFRTAPDPNEIKRACQLILASKKPVLIVGGGAHISGAYDQVLNLAELLQAPVITTISGKGIMAESYPLAFGVAGVFGNPIANDIIKQADLAFFIGSKAGQMTTMGYKCPDPQTPAIHLDLDPEEIGRNYPDSIPLLADVKLGLSELTKSLAGKKPQPSWDVNDLKQKHKTWYRKMVRPKQDKGGPLKPQQVMEAVNQVSTAEDLVVCDASLASGWAAAYFHMQSAGRRFLAPRGLAGLGWGAPAAIAAALASRKEKRILHFAGDGGFSYSVQELEVMVRLKLPVVTILLNNDTLAWIKHVQKDYYAGQYISTDFCHVDFATVAQGFGARGYTVNSTDDLSSCLALENSPQGPAVIEVITDQWETPVLKYSQS